MADFKTMVSRMKDDDKSALYINELRGFKTAKGRDEITLLTEKGWGQKLFSGRAVAVLLVIDRDEWERLHDGSEHKSKNIDSTESA